MRILGLMLLVAAGVYLSTSSSGTKKLRSQIGNQSNIGITHYQEGMAAKNLGCCWPQYMRYSHKS